MLLLMVSLEPNERYLQIAAVFSTNKWWRLQKWGLLSICNKEPVICCRVLGIVIVTTKRFTSVTAAIFLRDESFPKVIKIYDRYRCELRFSKISFTVIVNLYFVDRCPIFNIKSQKLDTIHCQRKCHHDVYWSNQTDILGNWWAQCYYNLLMLCYNSFQSVLQKVGA